MVSITSDINIKNIYKIMYTCARERGKKREEIGESICVLGNFMIGFFFVEYLIFNNYALTSLTCLFTVL